MQAQLRDFVVSMLLLSLALVLALYGASQIDQSHYTAGVVSCIPAVLISFYVAVRLVPRIAARSRKTKQP